MLPEGVDHRGVGVGHEQHVRLLDLLEPPDRRPVEAEALFEDVLGERVGGNREVLHEAGQVDEPDVHNLDALVLHQAEHFRRGPLLHASSLVWPIVGPVRPIHGLSVQPGENGRGPARRHHGGGWHAHSQVSRPRAAQLGRSPGASIPRGDFACIAPL